MRLLILLILIGAILLSSCSTIVDRCKGVYNPSGKSKTWRRGYSSAPSEIAPQTFKN